MVSVIIAAYNAESHISVTIQAVLNQTMSNFQLLIIDDCSSDSTWMRIQSFHDDRIVAYRLDENVGSGLARNYGLQRATGNIVAFCDADDVWGKDKLERQLELWDRSNYKWCCTAYRRFSENSALAIITPRKVITHGLLSMYCDIGLSTVMAEKEVFDKYLFENKRIRQDYLLWMNLTNIGYACQGIPKVLSEYRVHSNGISSNKLSSAKAHFHVLRMFHRFFVAVPFFFVYICRNIFLRLGEVLESIFVKEQIKTFPS